VKLPRQEVLQKLEDATKKGEGLTIYDASIEGNGRTNSNWHSTASKILEDFKEQGLAERKEKEGYRGAKPYFITPLGSELLKIAKWLSDERKNGKSITTMRLIQSKFGKEKVAQTVNAGLIKAQAPKRDEYEVICRLCDIDFLQLVPSSTISNQNILITKE
jgi:hypothetical protein